MGLIDKLKGRSSKDEAEVSGKHRRSSSLGRRRSLEGKTPSRTVGEVPQLPPLSDRPEAIYSVEGAGGMAGTSAKGKDKEVAGVTRGLEQTHLTSQKGTPTRPAYDERNLTNTPFNADSFLGGKESTTDYEQRQVTPIVQEVIRPQVEETIIPVFKREHHVIHHQTRIQPVLEQVVLPAKHYVVIDGKKHEVLPEAVTQYVLKSRDYIPMQVKPKVIVREYVDSEPLVGPILGVGASLVNKDVQVEHQRRINESYVVDKLHPQPIPMAVPAAESGHGASMPVTQVVGSSNGLSKDQEEAHRHASIKEKLFGSKNTTKHEPVRA